MKKRGICIVLSAIMSIAILVSGCGQTKESSAGGFDINLDELSVMEENTMPITEEDITLDVWTSNYSQGYVKSYNEFEAFHILADTTGVKLNFIHPTGNANEQLNIMLVSGDYPDVIYHNWSPSNARKRIKEGVTYDLYPYVEKLAPNFRKVLEQPKFKNVFDALSAELPILPIIRDDPRFNAYNSHFVRQDWLDKVGLDVPETIDEWEVVLKAFRDNDLNGNGDTTDEVPFTSVKGGDAYRYAFASGFGARDLGYQRDPDDPSKITHSVLRPEFKEYVTTLARWFKDGLLYSDYITSTASVIDSLILNDCLGAAYTDNNNSLPKYILARPDMKLVAAPYPKNPNGLTYNPRNSFTDRLVTQYGVMITTNCKHPIEAIRYFDYLYSKEASDLMYWGEEGVSYTVEPDGSYKFTDMILNDPSGKSPYEVICKYMTNVGFTGMHQNMSMVGLESNLSEDFKKIKDDAVNYALELDGTISLAGVPTTVEEDQQTSQYSDLTDYLNSMFDKFIIGAEPIEGYDAFVEKCKELGLEEVIAIKQKAIDRMEASK